MIKVVGVGHNIFCNASCLQEMFSSFDLCLFINVKEAD